MKDLEVINVPEEAIERFTQKANGHPDMEFYTVLITSDEDGKIRRFEAIQSLFDGKAEITDLLAAKEVELSSGEFVQIGDEHALFQFARAV